MMKIAIFGATSQIGKDLIKSFSQYTNYDCTLFARKPSVVKTWVDKNHIQQTYQALGYSKFNVKSHYDVIINFVGIGDPVRAKAMGSLIFDITYQYDIVILDYLKLHSNTQYIFLSSGAVYGNNFEQPVTENTSARIDINNLKSTDWYSIAKLYAEARHRALKNLSIVDVRIFNYFSSTQDINARFLITDIVRAIRDKTLFKTSSENIVRDFITPVDFFNLIMAIIKAGENNLPIDCYTKSPIRKFDLLMELKKLFRLEYKLVGDVHIVNPTGFKKNYFSKNMRASQLGYIPELDSMEGVIQQINNMWDE